MKKLFLALLIATRLFAADAANDLILSQRKADNSGNIQRNLAPTARGLFTFDASKIPASTTDLTYTTPTLSVPDAFAVSSAGSIDLTAGGAAKNILITPSTTGYVGIKSAAIPPAQSNVTLNVNRVLQVGFFASTPSFNGVRAQGSLGSEAAVASGNTLLAIAGVGWDTAAYSTGGGIFIVPTETWSGSARGTAINFNTIANGTTSFGQKFGIGNYGKLAHDPVAGSQSAWGATGALEAHGTATITDSSTAISGTAALATFYSFGAPTLAATNATVTTTDVFNGYFVAPIQGANQTISRKHTLGIVDSTSAASSITGGLIVATTLGTAATSVGIGGGNVNAGGDVNGATVSAAGSRINYNLVAYGTGTVYTLTNTAAAVAFGTTSPSVTLDKAGTYLISGHIQLAYTGATVVAETATVKLRRTNNTAVDLTSGSTVIDLPVATTLTYTYGTVQIPPVIYTTAATTDTITIFANVSATLGAGTITAEIGGTNIMAIRMY